jgi:NAD(P)-dependent dehydrogenase (short-subunit alcohol dehydrogenase family)
LNDLPAARLDGQVVIVTGGSQGVGLGIARAFLDAGATVVTCARSTFDTPPAARGEDDLDRCRHISADVRDESQIQAVVDAAVDEFGRLDVLVNNAGGQPPADTATVSARFIKSIIDINLTGPMIFAQKAFKAIEKTAGTGCIINISSQTSLPGGGGGTLAPYGAAKAGLNHMTRSLGQAWGRKVRVNCVSLGWVETEALAGLLLQEPGQRERYSADIPVGRMGTPEEIGGICVFLASPAAAYINGATVWADGGGGF